MHIIALDLDGTLLDSQKRLSDVNRAALAAAAERGALVVPTTGRFFGMMPEAVRDLPFVRYAITINGAQVYDRGYDVIYDCYRSNWGWMSEAFKAKAEDYATDEHYLRMIREFRRPVPELKAHLAATAADGDVQKIMLFTRRDAPEGYASQIAAAVAARFPEVKVTNSTWNNLEINIRTAHKGRALARFAEYLGLSLANCISFGDGANDLTMVEAAGVGVAMANACPEVLAAADYVTTSNDEDGVAAALRHFCLC